MPPPNGAAGPHGSTAQEGPGGRTLDRFGIRKLHDSVGKEWFSAWDAGRARTYIDAGDQSVDPELALANGDHTVRIFGADGPRAGQLMMFGAFPRIYVRKNESFAIPPEIAPNDRWNNVEVTFYAYSTGDSGVPWAGLEAVVKTNHWPDSWQCTTAGYGARMLFDGRIDFEKELYHSPNTNFQAGAISRHWTAADASLAGELPLNRWIGFKFVARNIDAGNDGDWRSDTRVRLELYKDMSIGDVVSPAPPANGGNWELVTAYTDDGDLSAGVPCAHTCSPDDDPYGPAGRALTWPNYSIYLRTDGLTPDIPQYYTWFSVREVAPVRDGADAAAAESRTAVRRASATGSGGIDGYHARSHSNDSHPS